MMAGSRPEPSDSGTGGHANGRCGDNTAGTEWFYNHGQYPKGQGPPGWPREASVVSATLRCERTGAVTCPVLLIVSESGGKTNEAVEEKKQNEVVILRDVSNDATEEDIRKVFSSDDENLSLTIVKIEKDEENSWYD